MLSAEAALRTGVGAVKILCSKKNFKLYHNKQENRFRILNYDFFDKKLEKSKTVKL